MSQSRITLKERIQRIRQEELEDAMSRPGSRLRLGLTDSEQVNVAPYVQASLETHQTSHKDGHPLAENPQDPSLAECA